LLVGREDLAEESEIEGREDGVEIADCEDFFH
jgi:hypothetical protein